MPETRTDRFDGWIAGVRTASGVRIVLGRWPRSPLGPFSDVMVERADGHRVLLAPSDEVAGYVSATYRFDEVRITPVEVAVAGARWLVAAGPLALRFDLGRGPPLSASSPALFRARSRRRSPGSAPPASSPGSRSPACGRTAPQTAAAGSSTARSTCAASSPPTCAGTGSTRGLWHPWTGPARALRVRIDPADPALVRMVTLVRHPGRTTGAS
jgi:hypothetical protein